MLSSQYISRITLQRDKVGSFERQIGGGLLPQFPQPDRSSLNSCSSA
jgi:hypothetical protein